MSVYSNQELQYLMPYNEDAEKSVLCSMLKEELCLNEGMQRLKSEDFYFPHHMTIFTCMQELQRQGKPVDLVTLNELVQKNGQLANFGGIQYLANLINFIPSTVNFKHYADIVLEKSTMRQLISASRIISEACYKQNDSLEDIVSLAEKKIFDISTRATSSESLKHIEEYLFEVYKSIETIAANPNQLNGVPTGFKLLDSMLTGLHEGELILIGARPGMGKTSFATNIVENAALKHKTVAVFSLEMPSKEIVRRMVCSQARVNMQSVRSGVISQADWASLASASSVLSSLNIYLDDTSSLRPSQLRSKLRKLMLTTHVDLAIIDYLQLMRADGKTESRQVEVSEISRSLKQIALELKLPIIACAQLSRDNTKRENKEPQLSDLRDSGAIEQDADVVMFVHRKNYYRGSDKEQSAQAAVNDNEAKIIVAKQRNGPIGDVPLYWIGELTRFENKGR